MGRDKTYLPDIIRRILDEAAAENTANEQARILKEEEERVRGDELTRRLALQEQRRKVAAEQQAALFKKIATIFWGSSWRLLLTSVAIVAALLVMGFYLYAPVQKTLLLNTYSDPFSYCKLVRTVDTNERVRDTRWTGEAFPVKIKEKLNGYNRPFRWRCENGAVYVCMLDKGNCFSGYPLSQWSNFSDDN
jgi:hypothetical protein